MDSGTCVRLDLPSETRLIDLVHSASEQVAVLAGFDEDEAMNVALAVREAAINAMRHGNREDPQLRVGVVLEATEDAVRVTISDQGAGFDPDATADPLAEENLLATSGRGLLLIRAFVDEVEFRQPDQGGTEIRLVKRRKA